MALSSHGAEFIRDTEPHSALGGRVREGAPAARHVGRRRGVRWTVVYDGMNCGGRTPRSAPWPHGPLAAICIAHVAQNWTNYTLSAWLPTYLHDELGMPTQQLSLMALPFAVNACASVGFGLVADRCVSSRRYSLLAVRRAATLTGLLGPAACHLLFPLTSSPGMAIAVVTLSFFTAGEAKAFCHR